MLFSPKKYVGKKSDYYRPWSIESEGVDFSLRFVTISILNASKGVLSSIITTLNGMLIFLGSTENETDAILCLWVCNRSNNVSQTFFVWLYESARNSIRYLIPAVDEVYRSTLVKPVMVRAYHGKQPWRFPMPSNKVSCDPIPFHLCVVKSIKTCSDVG